MESDFVDVLLLMGLAVANVWLFRRVNLPPILAYLSCGLLAGPELLNLYDNPDKIHFIAELGVVFLLFTLGLEFSLPKMLAMRHLVFGLGLGQVLLTLGAFMGGALLLGFSTPQAFVIGAMAALSSTAIVIKQLSEMGAINTGRGQMTVSVLLFQDLAVVPFLIVIPLLAADAGQNMGVVIATAVFKGALVVAILLSVGKWLLPRIFSEVARTRTDELFVLTALLVTLLAAGLTYLFGLSMALGAFLAGMMLSESQYRYQLEADIRPFRDILMGLFFITIGMRLALTPLFDHLHWVLLGVLVLMIGKIVLIRLIAWLFKSPGQDAWAAGIKLCQMGEFSFVLAALAVNHRIISPELSSMLLTIGVISMALTPYLIHHSKGLAKNLTQPPPVEQEDIDESHQRQRDHALIFGYGRVGQTVGRMLRVEAIPFVAVDADPIRVQEARSAGEPVLFGDGASKDILRAIGVGSAKLAIITFDEHHKAIGLIGAIQSLNPELPIVVRTRKEHRAEDFYLAGASQVIPEILEGSLMLVSQVLHLSGVPMSRILKRVREERKGHYGHMHGFYPGENTQLNIESQSKLEFLHAVILSPDAWAVGKPLREVNLASVKVVLKGLRRNNQEFANPDADTLLKANDVLVIAGKPRRVERAERYLLEGH
ncbi:cation:proton antiporter [Aliiglaciecola sp. CAU 1673]|uniref:monovalent cation:proton antiporter family protein n=1 Tax=Aliiglaciecola sp. CAU 1673 TaxID=3032595 RepID=UPI0023DB4C74|nr:monovalent cation:proton antiporter family protein [Aliiglaciecola sp. CAU 1673]MDF2179606.1 cation:proton antiporter [Aliiglaciecola sp. CAU 1673]